VQRRSELVALLAATAYRIEPECVFWLNILANLAGWLQSSSTLLRLIASTFARVVLRHVLAMMACAASPLHIL
jgi:hypothetical protein